MLLLLLLLASEPDDALTEALARAARTSIRVLGLAPIFSFFGICFLRLMGCESWSHMNLGALGVRGVGTFNDRDPNDVDMDSFGA